MKIDIIFSLPKTVLKKAKEALPRDLKEHICTAGGGGGAREERHQESAGHAARGQAPSWGMTSDVPISWSTEPLLCDSLAVSGVRLSSQLDQSCSLLLCVYVRVCTSVGCTLVVCCNSSV